MIFLIAAHLSPVSDVNAPRTVPLPTIENVKDAQPIDFGGNIIINGVCIDTMSFPSKVENLNCARTKRFDEFACSYNIYWEAVPASDSHWEQRMDIIFINVEGKSVRTRVLARPKIWAKGRWQG